jgi:hypothetical protein
MPRAKAQRRRGRTDLDLLILETLRLCGFARILLIPLPSHSLANSLQPMCRAVFGLAFVPSFVERFGWKRKGGTDFSVDTPGNSGEKSIDSGKWVWVASGQSIPAAAQQAEQTESAKKRGTGLRDGGADDERAEGRLGPGDGERLSSGDIRREGGDDGSGLSSSMTTKCRTRVAAGDYRGRVDVAVRRAREELHGVCGSRAQSRQIDRGGIVVVADYTVQNGSPGLGSADGGNYVGIAGSGA